MAKRSRCPSLVRLLLALYPGYNKGYVHRYPPGTKTCAALWQPSTSRAASAVSIMIALRLPLIAHQHLARPLRAQPLDGPPLDGQNNVQPRFLTPWEVRSTVSPRVSPGPSPSPRTSPIPSLSPHPRPDLGLTRRHVRVRGCAPPRRLSHRRSGAPSEPRWSRPRRVRTAATRGGRLPRRLAHA